MADGKQEFHNRTQGWIGAVVVNDEGKRESVAVEPGGTIWLDEREQRLTADAPRDPKNNPFIARQIELRDPKTGDVIETITAAPLELSSEERPLARRPIGVGATESGARAQGEETGVPVDDSWEGRG